MKRDKMHIDKSVFGGFKLRQWLVLLNAYQKSSDDFLENSRANSRLYYEIMFGDHRDGGEWFWLC